MGVKITDFGFAGLFDKESKMKTRCGTQIYCAPEILAGKPYDEKVDVFSLGVMLFTTVSGSHPWRVANEENDSWYKMWKDKRKKFWSYHKKKKKAEFTKQFKELCEGVLAPDPKDRWSMREVEKCAWLKGEKYTNKEAAQFL